MADGPTTARFGLMRFGLAPISGEGDVTVKHRRSPLSSHFSLYRGGLWVRRGGWGRRDPRGWEGKQEQEAMGVECGRAAGIG